LNCKKEQKQQKQNICFHHRRLKKRLKRNLFFYTPGELPNIPEVAEEQQVPKVVA
jgi:hypothetical protein